MKPDQIGQPVERALQTAVVMCTHNGARFVEEQLDSILTQSHVVDEIHIFDWQSSDGTRDIVQRWMAASAGKGSVASLSCMDTAPGPARSFLYALENVAGRSQAELIFICDQDDIWLPQKVKTFVDAYRAEGGAFDLAFSDVRVLANAGGAVVPTFYGAGSPYRRPTGGPDQSILLTNPAVGMTMCVRRAWIARLAATFDLYWIMHDWALMALCWMTGGRQRYFDVPLVSYRQHETNMLGASVSRSMLSRAGLIRSHIRNVRRQISSLRKAGERVGMVEEASASLARLRSNWGQAHIAATSAILTRRYRVLLSCAFMIF